MHAIAPDRVRRYAVTSSETIANRMPNSRFRKPGPITAVDERGDEPEQDDVHGTYRLRDEGSRRATIQRCGTLAAVRFTTTVRQNSKTATGIRVPDDVMDALAAGKAPKVAVTINGHTYRSSVATVNGEPMIGVSEAVRTGSGVQGGDTVEVDVVLDTAPRTVAVPDDLARHWTRSPSPGRPSTSCPTATSGSGSSRSRARRAPTRASGGSRRPSPRSARAGPLSVSPFAYTLRQSARSRHLRITIDPELGLVVTVPPPTRRGWANPQPRIDAFLAIAGTMDPAPSRSAGSGSGGARRPWRSRRRGAVRFRGDLHRLR